MTPCNFCTESCLFPPHLFWPLILSMEAMWRVGSLCISAASLPELDAAYYKGDFNPQSSALSIWHHICSLQILIVLISLSMCNNCQHIL